MVRRNNSNQNAGMLIDLDDGYIHMLGAAYENKQYSADKNNTS
jgi:hypothetical protein